MTILIQDSFNRANSTAGLGVADTGQSWLYIGDAGTTYGILDGQVYRTGTTDPRSSHVYQKVNSKNYKVTLTISLIGSASSRLWFRKESATGYAGYLIVNSAAQWRLAKYDSSGSYTVIGQVCSEMDGDKLTVETREDGFIKIEIYRADSSLGGSLEFTDTFSVLETENYIAVGTNSTNPRWDNFIVEAIETNTGTNGSISFDSKQLLYSNSSYLFDIRQQIFNISANTYDTKQSLYEIFDIMYDTMQGIFDVGNVELDTKQAIYKSDNSQFDLKQEIYKLSQSDGDMRLVIYSTDTNEADMLQNIYSDDVVNFDVKNEIYKRTFTDYDIKQIIYKYDQLEYDLEQRLYNSSSTDFDTMQQILENFKAYRQVFEYQMKINTLMGFEMNLSGTSKQFNMKI